MSTGRPCRFQAFQFKFYGLNGKSQLDSHCGDVSCFKANKVKFVMSSQSFGMLNVCLMISTLHNIRNTHVATLTYTIIEM